MSHTPGPWRAQLWSNGRVRSFTVGPDPQAGAAVARRVKSAADARLIAAAPTMLDALREAESTIQACLPIGADSTLATVRTAIARATGGEA